MVLGKGGIKCTTRGGRSSSILNLSEVFLHAICLVNFVFLCTADPTIPVRRIGEASNPGPPGASQFGPNDPNNDNNEKDLFTVIGVNGTAIRPRWQTVANWPATVCMFQETRLGQAAQEKLGTWMQAKPYRVKSVFGSHGPQES